MAHPTQFGQQTSVIASSSRLCCCRRTWFEYQLGPQLNTPSATASPASSFNELEAWPSSSSGSASELRIEEDEYVISTEGSQSGSSYDLTTLSKELISKSLNDAGLQSESLRGQDISLTIYATTAGQQYETDSELKSISERMASFFDFRGPTSLLSGCIDPAVALRQGIDTLHNDGCRFAVVGAVATSCCCGTLGANRTLAVDDNANCVGAGSHASATFLILKADDAADSTAEGQVTIRALVLSRSKLEAAECSSLSPPVQVLRRALSRAGVDESIPGILDTYGLDLQYKDYIEAEALQNLSLSLTLNHNGRPSCGCEMLQIYVGISKALQWYKQYEATYLMGEDILVDSGSLEPDTPNALKMPSFPGPQAYVHGNITSNSVFAQILAQSSTGALSSLVLTKALKTNLRPAEDCRDLVQVQTQSEVDAMIRKYGGPLTSYPIVADLHHQTAQRQSVLLTGANGSFGSHVLSSLLLNKSVERIVCLIRGNAWERLSLAFTHAGYSLVELCRAQASGRLVVYPTQDLAADKLGCRAEDYEEITRTVNTIVHLAWKLDFNLPVSQFESHIKATRNLAELCRLTQKETTYHFISSFSAYALYPEELIPETPLLPCAAYSLDQGYAHSKLIAEHVLFSIHAHDPEAFNLRIVRVGQIGGNSVTGQWSLDEMVPMMIQAAPVLESVLTRMPDVQWIPSDVCASALTDLVTAPLPHRQHVLHLANPEITAWTDVAERIGKICGLNNIHLLSEREYIDVLNASEEALPVKRLLPFLHGVTLKGGLPWKFTLLDVTLTSRWSRSLSECPRIDDAFLRRVVDLLLKVADNDQSAHPLPVLLFGPWTKHAGMDISPEISARVARAAERTKTELGITEENPYVKSSLATLMSQLSVYERMKEKMIIPGGVLGYCLGEYAAAVVAGVLTVENAVDLLIRRSVAFDDIDGRMLNVFTDITTTRKLLLRVSNAPDIAIHSGPRHCVLSGTPQQIDAAQAVFVEARVKARAVESSVIPFHSSALDKPIASLSFPETERLPSECIYISGLLGQPINGESIGPNYWLRHMRDRVHFVDAMNYVRMHFPRNPLVDMGPGPALTSIISKYEWESVKAVSVDDFLSSISDNPFHLSASTRVENHNKEPSKPAIRVTHDYFNIEVEAVRILASKFGFVDLSVDDLMTKSFLQLGLQSLDFIIFTSELAQATRKVVPAHLYASDQSISEILRAS